MRIPTSVIVMSLLTAAPFGLGIRDALKAKPAGEGLGLGLDDDDRQSARADRKQLEEYEAEAAREAEENAKQRDKKLAVLDTLAGPEKASMGTFLDGFVLGTPETPALAAKMQKLAMDGVLDTTLSESNHVVSAVSVLILSPDDELSSDELCERVRTKLTAAWGPSVSGTWIDPKLHQRASLSESPCKFTVDRYVEPAAWVAALPIDALGQPKDKLATKVADLGGDISGEDEISWYLPGTGYGQRATELFAAIDHGKVASVRAEADSDFDSLLAIRDALSARLKAQPTRDEDTGAWVWKKKPGFTLQQAADSNRFTLQIGKDPYQ